MSVKFDNLNKRWSKEDIEKCLDLSKSKKELANELGRSVGAIENCRRIYSGVDLDELFKKRGETKKYPVNFLYHLWVRLRSRCKIKTTNPQCAKDKCYTWYEPWNDFETFEKWCIENGYSDEKLQYLLRKNTLKGYSPENCFFREYLGQHSPLKNMWEYNGEFKTLEEWSSVLGVSVSSLKSKVKSYEYNNTLSPHKFNLETVLNYANRKKPKKAIDGDRVYEFNDESHTLIEWATIMDIPFKVLHRRIFEDGWSFEKALTYNQPVKKEKDVLRFDLEVIEGLIRKIYQKGLSGGQDSDTDDFKKGMLYAHHLIENIVKLTKPEREGLFNDGILRNILSQYSIFEIDSICSGKELKEPLLSYDVGDEIVVSIDGVDETMIICKKDGNLKDPVYHAFNSDHFWTGKISQIRSKTGHNSLRAESSN